MLESSASLLSNTQGKLPLCLRHSALLWCRHAGSGLLAGVGLHRSDRRGAGLRSWPYSCRHYEVSLLQLSWPCSCNPCGVFLLQLRSWPYSCSPYEVSLLQVMALQLHSLWSTPTAAVSSGWLQSLWSIPAAAVMAYSCSPCGVSQLQRSAYSCNPCGVSQL